MTMFITLDAFPRGASMKSVAGAQFCVLFVTDVCFTSITCIVVWMACEFKSCSLPEIYICRTN